MHWYRQCSSTHTTAKVKAVGVPAFAGSTVLDSDVCNALAGMYQIREANQMIEEYMLLANVSVAEKILKHFPSCSLLRLGAV